MTRIRQPFAFAGLIGFALVLASCFLVFFWVVRGCVWLLDCAPDSSVDVSRLELPKQLLPSAATLGRIGPSNNSYGARAFLTQNAYWNGGNSTMQYTIIQLGGYWDAEMRYSALVEQNREYLPIALSSAELTSLGIVSTADQNEILCDGTPPRKCEYISRHSEYVVSLVSSIDDEFSLSGFIKVVSYIEDSLELVGR